MFSQERLKNPIKTPNCFGENSLVNPSLLVMGGEFGACRIKLGIEKFGEMR